MPRCDIVVLVPHPSRPQILVRTGSADRLTLPTTVVEGQGATRSWALATLAAFQDGIALTRVGHADG